MMEKHVDKIVDLCKRFNVRQLDLFGSASRGGFSLEQSDLDFFVEFNSMPPSEHADCYFRMLEALEDMFSRSIDLVETTAVKNPYFSKIAEQSRTTLYAA
ncbi:nucleotidyltransferase domain-containing protein [bacterium]|nr:nucleotidyltransferase domain-containing protein [candidate division CSSED10-310 bacterium]